MKDETPSINDSGIRDLISKFPVKKQGVEVERGAGPGLAKDNLGDYMNGLTRAVNSINKKREQRNRQFGSLRINEGTSDPGSGTKVKDPEAAWKNGISS